MNEEQQIQQLKQAFLTIMQKRGASPSVGMKAMNQIIRETVDDIRNQDETMCGCVMCTVSRNTLDTISKNCEILSEQLFINDRIAEEQLALRAMEEEDEDLDL